ncbi:helix-turn-helix domain-containing protein [Nocardia pseudovaccinii]|uniref:helix-turn-helix domain-containing protein n=1 Tax=Nocardia pseudovaccinii TaxID=189540 RepID=UPI0007A5372C|nr:helix-turn-helix transcriptional regulator [Nocardia pseudovaccinii]
MADDELEDTGTTLPRRQLGRLLRDARTATGMNLEAAAALIQWSRPTLSRLERGETEKVRVLEILALCEAYGLSEERTAVAQGLAELAPVKSWWHAYSDLIPAWANLYVGLESSATVLTVFQPLIVPGLLQTTDYARTVDKLYFPDDTNDEIERRVQVRIQRQHILTRSRSQTKATVILHENVLRTMVGNRALMAAQCRHIADMSTRDNIEIRILPFHAGIPLGAATPPFTIMDFDRDTRSKQVVVEPSQVYCEGYAGSVYLEGRAELLTFRKAFRKLHQASLDPRPSRDMLREIAARRHESER